MSANNRIVVVKNPDGTHEVWYDACVDNPFPYSANKLAECASLEEALELADKHDDGHIEYGISYMDGPVVPISEEEFEQILEAEDRARQDALRDAIANGACVYCSNEWMQTYHNAATCERNPHLPRNIIRKAIDEEYDYLLNSHKIAQTVLEALERSGIRLVGVVK